MRGADKAPEQVAAEVDAVTADEIAVLGEDTSLRDKFTKRQW